MATDFLRAFPFQRREQTVVWEKGLRLLGLSRAAADCSTPGGPKWLHGEFDDWAAPGGGGMHEVSWRSDAFPYAPEREILNALQGMLRRDQGNQPPRC